MAKKKEVKEVVKAPMLRNENENEEEVYETDVRPFCINFGKSWLECTNVETVIERDSETGARTLLVFMSFTGQLKENEEPIPVGELQFNAYLPEEE